MNTSANVVVGIVAAGFMLAGADAWSEDDAAAATAPTAATAPARRLDLRPPDITKLLTPKQLEDLLEKLDKENIEEVEVEGGRVPAPSFTPRVWAGIAAPFWALFHPTQAWRILAPIPPDQARFIGNQQFTTEGYLEPVGVPPGDPFKR
ncbi:MAG TPA: hypothetical protein VJQ52_20625 [Steroidobacteraceae bacterium]|nr:hypothetical protein [Steroidobacteraceae bacterium]